jgi:hypothetical protein
MLLRISLRRSFLYLLGVTCFLFLAVNVHQRELWARSLLAAEMGPGGANPLHSAAGSRGSDSAQAVERLVIGTSNLLEAAVDEEGKDMEEDQVTADEGKFRIFALKFILVQTVSPRNRSWRPVRV